MVDWSQLKNDNDQTLKGKPMIFRLCTAARIVVDDHIFTVSFLDQFGRPQFFSVETDTEASVLNVGFQLTGEEVRARALHHARDLVATLEAM